MKTIMYLLFASFLFLSACKKSHCGFGEPSGIMGKWKWVETSGGFGGVIETPANTGNDISLELLADGTYTMSRNKVMPQLGNYALVSQFCYHKNQAQTALKLDNNDAMTIESLNTDSLVLSDEYADGFTYTYTR